MMALFGKKVTKLLRYQILSLNQIKTFSCSLQRLQSNAEGALECDSKICVGDATYERDDFTNVNKKILSHLDRKLHLLREHPISFTKQRIVKYIYGGFLNKRRNPLFSVHDDISPIVNAFQNFDSLCIPLDHPSRKKSDTYYINSENMLRGHTSAHQHELIKSGLNNFLVVGDVYRKDEIDSMHYPVFHQIEAVRLRSQSELFQTDDEYLQIFEQGDRTNMKQECHTLEAVKLMEHELKTCLVGLVQCLFGSDVKYRWVDAYFPFTHPSFELEMFHNEKWIELLGCGIMEHKLLQSAGAVEKIGWAFGLGLERLAMILYQIPDIRLFWSREYGFLTQFEGKTPFDDIAYKSISKFGERIFDLSFWTPDDFVPNDFFELARNIGGDLVEQIKLIDEFVDTKRQRKSMCYRILYRHMERALSKEEVNDIHKEIASSVEKMLHVQIR